MRLFVSQCGHYARGSWCLNCILLLFFRPWGRLCNCITYQLLCSVVTGCTWKCTVSEFPKTAYFFLAVYHTFLYWPFWRVCKLVISFILLTIHFTLYHNIKQNVWNELSREKKKKKEKKIEVGIVSWLTSNCNLNSVIVTVLAKSCNINNSFTSVRPCIIPAGWCYCVVGVIWIFLNLYIIFIPPVSGFGVATGHTKQCSCGTFIQSWSCCSFECNCWAHCVKQWIFINTKVR